MLDPASLWKHSFKLQSTWEDNKADIYQAEVVWPDVEAKSCPIFPIIYLPKKELPVVSTLKAHLHYDENVVFLYEASWFYEPENFSLQIKWPILTQKRLVFVVV